MVLVGNIAPVQTLVLILTMKVDLQCFKKIFAVAKIALITLLLSSWILSEFDLFCIQTKVDAIIIKYQNSKL